MRQQWQPGTLSPAQRQAWILRHAKTHKRRAADKIKALLLIDAGCGYDAVVRALMISTVERLYVWMAHHALQYHAGKDIHAWAKTLK